MRTGLFCILLVILCFCAPALAAESPAQETRPSPFSGGPADAIWTVIAFVVLLVSLWRFAWKPLLTALNFRQEHIEKQISDAENIRKDAESTLADYNAKLADVDKQGKGMIESYLKKAERQAQDVIDDAKEKIGTMTRKVEADIGRARAEAEAELFVKSGEIILKLGQEILGRTISSEDNQRLIDQAVERLKQEHENAQKG